MTPNPSRKKTIEARERAKKYRRVYRRIAAKVYCIRKRLGLTQPEFAALLGISEISVRRWELALGHKPNTKVWKQIKGLSDGHTVNSSKAVQRIERDRSQENHPQ